MHECIGKLPNYLLNIKVNQNYLISNYIQ